MSHMVIYRGADGKPGYHQTDEILDAVAFVERIRNEQAVEHARIFRLEEVQFEFRPYYRVELSTGGTAPAAVPGGGNGSAVETTERAQGEAPVEQEGTVPPPTASPGVPSAGGSPTTGGAGDGDEAIGSRRGLFGR